MSAVAPAALIFTPGPALRAATALLEGAGLLAKDLTPAHLEHFFCCGAAESPTGLVGLELFGANALLRSLVVSREMRRAGVGAALVRHAEGYARSHGVRALYLLTTTAEKFFAKRGYVRIARESTAPAIQGTYEFDELFPESATVMLKAL
jgi:amino-acid N-acetyltransferase